MSRTQLQPLQLTSLPRAHEHDEYTARPGGNRSTPLWDCDANPSSPTIESTPGLPLGLSRPLTQAEQEKLSFLDRLKFFLATAPSRWDTSGSNASAAPSDPYLNMGMGMNSVHQAPTHPALNRFLLPNQEYVTCVLWNGLYHITGTDIVRALVFRFEAFGRPVRNMKKFEEGVFSDLRNLKPGQDASLEEPKSPFLDLLFKYQCIRTQKKQKVFYWFSVPHDRLFLDALERDLKREKMGSESTTEVVGEPANSFIYDGAFKRSLYEQFVKAAGGKDGEGELERVVRGLDENGLPEQENSDVDNDPSGDESATVSDSEGSRQAVGGNNKSPFFNMFSLFEGSPTYKQRRKKNPRPSALSSAALASTTSAQHGVMADGMEGVAPNAYQAGEQYTSYSYGDYHPNSSSPGTTRFPANVHNGYSMDIGYGHGGYAINGMSDTGNIRVKQEPVSAAEMFLRQARGELPNAAGPTPAEIRAMKRHTYAGAGIDTTSIPVWLEGKFAGVGMAATSSAPPPPFASRGRSLDDSMSTMDSSPYMQTQQNLPPGTPYMSAGSMSGSPHSSSPPTSEHSPQPTSDSSSGPLASSVAAEAAFPNPVTIPGTSSSGTSTTIKAYACPLLSCGRLFKRMEHLKRHLRTHTMERPFVCTRDGCGKRFSRNDNLGQHLRVCRGGKFDATNGDTEGTEKSLEGDSLGLTGMEWGVTVGEWINSEVDDEPILDGENGHRTKDTDMDDGVEGRPQQPPATSNIAAGLNMFGGSNGLGMGMGMSAGVSGAPLDAPMEMYEVELTGDVRDVPGDEEGLLRVHVRGNSGDDGYSTGGPDYMAEQSQSYGQPQQLYDSSGYMTHHPSSLNSQPYPGNPHPHIHAPAPSSTHDSQLDSQWAMRSTPSPAFSTISVPAISPNRNSWGRPSPTLMRQNSNGNSYGGDDSSVSYHHSSASLPVPGTNQMSVSAPSHKLAFDHNNMYPQGMLDPSFAGSMGGLSVDSTGGGPVRRHRSMTPSLIRGADGGLMRRQANGAGDNMGMNGYHPYAGSSRASSLSRGGSVHSSPAGHQLPLPGMGMQRSESRASSLSVEVSGAEHLQRARLSRPNSADPMAAANRYQGEMYRTESPAPFAQHIPASGQVTDSPGTFVMDLPETSYHHHPHPHAATVPAHFGMNAQLGAHGNYYPHHVSTI